MTLAGRQPKDAMLSFCAKWKITNLVGKIPVNRLRRVNATPQGQMFSRHINSKK